MLDDAADHFARFGFDSSTRALAAALNVTQGLIYKHFGSKEELITLTLERAFGVSSRARRFDGQVALGPALRVFYSDFVGSATETRMRLFMRAGLDGLSWPTKRGEALTTIVFVPVIEALRREADLPTIAERPAMRGERELVMMLHASMVFLGIRRHVYGMPMPENLDDVVAQNVDLFLRGAIEAIRNLHENGVASLKVQLLTRDS